MGPVRRHRNGDRAKVPEDQPQRVELGRETHERSKEHGAPEDSELAENADR